MEFEVDNNVVEQTKPQQNNSLEKKYTDDDLNSILAKKIARREAKIRKEYESKYSKYKEAEEVLNAGMGTKNIEEATINLRDFYSKKGIEMPQFNKGYSEEEENILANAQAQDIINGGYDELVEEVDRLADKGVKNMTPREKLIFTRLAEARKTEEGKRELAKIGVKSDIFNDSKFNEFKSMFDTKTPIQKVYEMYQKINPTKQIEPIGSLSGTPEEMVKDFYTPDEARRLTSKDLDNPKIMEAVEKSMAIWYKGR